MRYKGFIGSVDFNEEDNVFFGKIEDIDGLVNFEGSSVEELESAFHEAVDDYIAYRKKENAITPALQAKIDLAREEHEKGETLCFNNAQDAIAWMEAL